jgi:hypothetical protein
VTGKAFWRWPSASVRKSTAGRAVEGSGLATTLREALRTPRFWIGVAISVALMAVALRGVNLRDVARELQGVDYVWLLPAAATVVIGQLGRAYRWRLLFGSGPRPSGRMSFGILSVGYLVSNVLPLRLGDGVRAWLIETRTPADGAAALATVVVERVVDLLVILLFLGLWVPGPGVAFAQRYAGAPAALTVTTLRWAVVGLAASAYVGLAVVSTVGGPAARILQATLSVAGVAVATSARVGAGVGRFLSAFRVLRNPSVGIGVLAATAGLWWIGAVGYWFVFRAFHLDLPLAWAVFAMCAAAIFAAVLPPAPGYAGTFHLAVKTALVLLADLSPGRDMSSSLALSYAVVLHALTLAILILLGVAATLYLGVPAEALAGAEAAAASGDAAVKTGAPGDADAVADAGSATERA